MPMIQTMTTSCRVATEILLAIGIIRSLNRCHCSRAIDESCVLHLPRRGDTWASDHWRAPSTLGVDTTLRSAFGELRSARVFPTIPVRALLYRCRVRAGLSPTLEVPCM